MDKIIGISNIEIYEFCKLNLETGEKKFFDDYSGFEKFDGFYFKDRENFFVIFASEEGPKLYFKDNVYQLRKDLHISLKEMDTVREFRIEEYNICIKYHCLLSHSSNPNNRLSILELGVEDDLIISILLFLFTFIK